MVLIIYSESGTVLDTRMQTNMDFHPLNPYRLAGVKVKEIIERF